MYLNTTLKKYYNNYLIDCLQVVANDTDGLDDTARVFIYLLREDQRVRFVLRQHPPEIRSKIEHFREYVIYMLTFLIY